MAVGRTLDRDRATQLEEPRESDDPHVEGAELLVLARGQPIGRFGLMPEPGTGLSLDQRVVAVALADQVGAVLATTHVHDDGRTRRYG